MTDEASREAPESHLSGWRFDLLDAARGALGSAIHQSLPTDDQNIMENVRSAYEKINFALARTHIHVAGTTVGKHIDECAVCGYDIRAHGTATPRADLAAAAPDAASIDAAQSAYYRINGKMISKETVIEMFKAAGINLHSETGNA